MIQGEIQTFPQTDLIRWIALTRRTGELAITQGDQQVKFFFAAGEIAAASSSDLIGPDSPENVRGVLASSLSWSSGYFDFKDDQLPAEVSANNLRLPVEALLLEIASKRDQSQSGDAELGEGDWNRVGEYSETFTLADDLRLQVVDHLLREDFRVPPVPQLAARVLELTSKEDFSLRDLENLILSDQAVTAQVLRYANSALHNFGRQVNTLQLAIQRLGSDEVVHIALAASVQAQRPGRDIFAEEKRQLWLHSAATAFFATVAGRSCRSRPQPGILVRSADGFRHERALLADPGRAQPRAGSGEDHRRDRTRLSLAHWPRRRRKVAAPAGSCRVNGLSSLRRRGAGQQSLYFGRGPG